jgi:hypothetical protein
MYHGNGSGETGKYTIIQFMVWNVLVNKRATGLAMARITRSRMITQRAKLAHK